MKKKQKKIKGKWYGISVIGIALLFFVLFLSFSGGGGKAGEIKDIEIFLELSKEEIASGEEVTFTFSYDNTGNDVFANASAQFVFPIGFVLKDTSEPDHFMRQSQTWEIGRVKAGENKQIEISGFVFGDIVSTQSITAQLYVKSAQSQEFDSMEIEKQVQITDTVLSFDISMPESFPLLSLTDFEISYEYPDDFPYTLFVEFERPKSVSFVNMNVEQADNQFLMDQEVLKRQPIKGNVFADATGQISDELIFHLYVIGSGRSFLQATKTIPFTAYDTGARFSATINEQMQDIALHVGKQNSFAIYVRNVGNAVMNDVKIDIPLSSYLIDEEKLQLTQGIYEQGSLHFDQLTDVRLGQVLPGQSFAMLFSIPIQEDIVPEHVFPNVRDEIPLKFGISYNQNGSRIQTQIDEMIAKLNSDLHYSISEQAESLDVYVSNTLNWVSDTIFTMDIAEEPDILSVSRGQASWENGVLTWKLGQLSPGKQQQKLSLSLPESYTNGQINGFDMHTEQEIHYP